MATQNAYVNRDEVMLSACRLAQDPGGGVLGVPFYEAAIRDALRELCFETNWDVRAIEEPIPENRMVKLPELVALRNLFLFNGEECNVGACAPVHIKPNYSHKGGDGFFANQQGNNSDVMVQDTWWRETPGLFYGGITSGILYLSPSCTAFTKIRIEYVGTGQKDKCQLPPIPVWAVEAIRYWVAMRACESRQIEGRLFQQLARNYAAEIQGYNGAWRVAKMRYQRMDQKQRMDQNLYNSFFGPGAGF